MCPDLTIGGQYSRSHNLTAITLGGDKVDRKGALTGGFHDVRRSRLDSIKGYKRWQDTCEREEAELKERKTRELRLNQEVTKLLSDIEIAQRRLDQARGARQPLVEEAGSLKRELEQLEARLVRLQQTKTDLENEISNIKVQIDGFKEELDTPMLGALSDEDAETLNALSLEIQVKRRELSELTKDRSSVSIGHCGPLSLPIL